MTDQPTQPTPEPTPSFAYEPVTVPAAAAATDLPDPAPRSGSNRTWWIVAAVAGGLALWVFGFVGGVAASQLFDGDHDFDRHGMTELQGGPLPMPGGEMPGGEMPGGEMPGTPDFDDDDDSGSVPPAPGEDSGDADGESDS